MSADPWGSASRSEWALRLAVPQLELHPELPSTNDRLRELASEGAAPFTTVVAVSQTRGRGRSGKMWHSAPGSGLWVSVLLSVPREQGGAPGGPGVITLAVGVATARAIEAVTGIGASLKWPNDVLCRGRKVCGILCETSGEASGPIVAGIGVNLRRPGGFPEPLGETAGFLEEESGRPIREPDLARALLGELRTWAAPAPATMTSSLRAEWERRDGLAGRRVVLDDGGSGVCRGIEADGALRLEETDGAIRWVRTGSVREAR